MNQAATDAKQRPGFQTRKDEENGRIGRAEPTLNNQLSTIDLRFGIHLLTWRKYAPFVAESSPQSRLLVQHHEQVSYEKEKQALALF